MAKLGVALADSAGAPQPKPMSKGQLIAGILADALAGAMGQQGQFAAMNNARRQQEEEDVRWGKRLQMQKQLNPEKPHYWEMNDGSLGVIGPDGKPQVAYKDPTPRANLDPDVTVTLPNGQFYAGPRSGLAQALMGGGSTPVKTAPRGKLTPVQGGLTPPASGGFPDIGPYRRF